MRLPGEATSCYHPTTIPLLSVPLHLLWERGYPGSVDEVSMPLPAADHDVAVLGAGAAGLAAARLLTQHGLSVALIEARDRIGGRLLSLRAPGVPVPVELGGAFVHGRPPETMALVRAASATLYEHGGEVLSHFGGRW